MIRGIGTLRALLSFLFFFAAAIASAQTAPAQPLTGHWQGSFSEERREVIFTATFDAAGKGALEVLGQKLPITSSTVTGTTVEFQAGAATFNGTLAANTISGTFTEGKSKLPF